MLVLCDNCNSKYKITIKKNPGKPVTFKCGKCQNLIRISVDQITAQIGGGLQPPPEPRDEAQIKAETVKVACLKCGNKFIKPANEKSPICYQCRIDALVSKVKDKYGVSAPAPEIQESRYTIRSADGLVLGPIKLRTVAVLAREKRIKGVEEVSKDGADYVPLMKFPELAELFPDMKEIMDTTGLEDKVEEAFMAAFGGEEKTEEKPEPPLPEKAEAAGGPEPVEPLPQAPAETEPAEEPPEPAPEPAEPTPPSSEAAPEAQAEEKEQQPAASEDTGDEAAASEESAAPEEAEIQEPAPPAADQAPGVDEEEDEVIDWGQTKKEEKPAESPAEAPAPEAQASAEPAPPPAPTPEEKIVEPEAVGTEFEMEGEEQEKEEEEIIEDLVPLSEAHPDTRYRIRYPDGLILGPVKLGTIKELFNTGNLTGQEEVQRESDPWAGFAELPELAELVAEADIIGEDGVIELTDALEESG